MPAKPKPTKEKAIELIKEALEKGTYDSKKIAEATGYTPVHINRLRKEIERQLKQEQPIEIKPETPKIEIEEEIKEIPEIPELKPTPEITEKIEEAIEEGFITEEETFALFSGINELLGKYKRPESAIRVVARAWVKPLNRYIGKIENVDLIFAVIVTAIVFAPSVKQYVEDRRKAKQQKEEKEGEKK